MGSNVLLFSFFSLFLCNLMGSKNLSIFHWLYRAQNIPCFFCLKGSGEYWSFILKYNLDIACDVYQFKLVYEVCSLGPPYSKSLPHRALNIDFTSVGLYRIVGFQSIKRTQWINSIPKICRFSQNWGPERLG